MPSFSQSRFAARLQNVVFMRREEVGLYKEIEALLPRLDGGRVLDVGTGSGLQLRAIHEARPQVQLFGLDFSRAAMRVAQENLQGMDVELRQGSINDAPYEDGFFDIVTCNASMSYWKGPVGCFNEIYRILKPGGSGVLFEPQKEIDLDEVRETIDRNLADKSRFRRLVARSLNVLGLRWGHTLGLRLYALDELRDLAQSSLFGVNHALDRVTLQNLPIFVRITLTKLTQERPVSRESPGTGPATRFAAAWRCR